MHGTTFGGNPLACAAAIAIIDEIKQSHLLHHIRETGGYFLAQLRELQKKHPAIVDVRGLGLMIGIELNSADLARQILSDMLARRIILNRTHETVLRFLPPFVITREHVDQTIAALDDLLLHHTAARSDELTTKI
jgi:acetylornithine aminotransferase/acetylornithine/N-succinyldiaminopimelate aminotransferase